MYCSVKPLAIVTLLVLIATVCHGKLNLRRFDRCRHDGREGLCRPLSECPGASQAPQEQATCNTDTPPLVCCVNRAIFFPGASPSPPTTTARTSPPSTTTFRITAPNECKVVSPDAVCVPVQNCPRDGQPVTRCLGAQDGDHICCTKQVEQVPIDQLDPEVLPTEPSKPSAEAVVEVDSAIDLVPPETDSNVASLDISNPSQGSFIPTCGYRADWSTGEQALPQYTINGSVVDAFSSAAEADDTLVNAWPWTALLGYASADGETDWQCGGSLINSQWIVTAAHCLQQRFPVTVRLGDHDYSRVKEGAQHQDFGLASAEVYPGYSPETALHDLALIQLNKPVNYSESFFEVRPRIVPVCLPWGEESTANLISRTAALTGWEPHNPDVLEEERNAALKAEYLTIAASRRCNDSYSSQHYFQALFPNGITGGDFVCAVTQAANNEPCDALAGTPLVYNSADNGFVLAGLVANGFGCGLDDLPGIYTPLHKPEYLAWIRQRAFA